MFTINTSETKNGKVIRAHGGKGIAKAYAKTTAKADKSREENHRYAAEKAISEMVADEVSKGHSSSEYKLIASVETSFGFTHSIELT